MSDLRNRIARKPLLVAPGCTDALFALMIERAGFPAAYLSGASIAYTRLGRPDAYFASLAEHGTTAPFQDRMLDVKGINDVVGTEALLETGTRYA